MAPSPYDLSCWWDIKHKHNNLLSYKQFSATEIHHYLGLNARKLDFVAYEQQRRRPVQSYQCLCYSLICIISKVASCKISIF